MGGREWPPFVWCVGRFPQLNGSPPPVAGRGRSRRPPPAAAGNRRGGFPGTPADLFRSRRRAIRTRRYCLSSRSVVDRGPPNSEILSRPSLFRVAWLYRWLYGSSPEIRPAADSEYKNGAGAGTRTPDPRFKRPLL